MVQRTTSYHEHRDWRLKPHYTEVVALILKYIVH